MFPSMYLFLSCGPNKKQQEEKLRQEVMAIHDEVMPKTEELFKLRKNLQKLVDSLNLAKYPDTILGNLAKQLVVKLKQADEAMMDWMHNYNGGSGIYDHEELMNYLSEEKEKIQNVKSLILESIDSAHAFLQKKI